MFTGIIEEIGEIVDLQAVGDSRRLTVRGPLVVSDASHGDSIAVSGVCLTVVEQGADWFTADVMAQTLAMSTFERLEVGTRVNLERAASVGSRLGGHIVQGHIDGTSTVLEVRPGDAWRVLRFSLDPAHAPLVVDKGSITVDGVSLTVSAAGDDWFEVSLIPETLTATTLGARAVGEPVNIETDILARHVQRMLRFTTFDASGASDATDADSGSPASNTDTAPHPNDLHDGTRAVDASGNANEPAATGRSSQ